MPVRPAIFVTRRISALAGPTKQSEPATKPFQASRAVGRKHSGFIHGSNRGVE
jgi:hypothetical protein